MAGVITYVAPDRLGESVRLEQEKIRFEKLVEALRKV